MTKRKRKRETYRLAPYRDVWRVLDPKPDDEAPDDCIERLNVLSAMREHGGDRAAHIHGPRYYLRLSAARRDARCRLQARAVMDEAEGRAYQLRTKGMDQ